MTDSLSAGSREISPVEWSRGEKEGKLYLNTTPCNPAQENDSVIFHKPYTKTAAGEIVCFGHHFDKVSVRQQ